MVISQLQKRIRRSPGPYLEAKEWRLLEKKHGLDVLAESMIGPEYIEMQLNPRAGRIFNRLLTAGELPREAMKAAKRGHFPKYGMPASIEYIVQRPIVYDVERLIKQKEFNPRRFNASPPSILKILKALRNIEQSKRQKPYREKTKYDEVITSQVPAIQPLMGMADVAKVQKKYGLTDAEAALLEGIRKIRDAARNNQNAEIKWLSPQKASRVLDEITQLNQQLKCREQPVKENGKLPTEPQKSVCTREEGLANIQKKYRLTPKELAFFDTLEKTDTKWSVPSYRGGEKRIYVEKHTGRVGPLEGTWPRMWSILHEIGHLKHSPKGGWKASPIQKELFANAFWTFSSIKLEGGTPEQHKKLYTTMSSSSLLGENVKRPFFIIERMLERYPNKEELLHKGPIVIRELTRKKMNYKEMLKKLDEMLAK